MGISDFVHLDNLPFNDSYFIDGIKSNPTVELDYREQLNLAFNIYNVDDAISARIKSINNFLNRTSVNKNEVITLYDLSLLLESFLYLIINTSSITQLDQASLTQHNYKRKRVISNHLVLPPPQYLTKLTFTGEKTWGGKYGSVSYALHLLENKENYLHPSQICYFSNLYWFKNLADRLDNYTTFSKDLEAYIKEDSSRADNFIYLAHKQVLLEDLELGALCHQLDFLEYWLPIIISWYVTKTYTLTEGDTEYQLYLLLADISKVCLAKVTDESSYQDLLFKFVHQEISYDYLELIKEINIIKTRFDIQIINPVSELEILAAPFINNTAFKIQVEPKQLGYQLLESFSPPGGFNQWLLNISSALLNRAYILAYNNSQINSTITIDNTKVDVESTDVIGRIYKLIYLAGFVLKKSNIDAINIIGFNLIQMTRYKTIKQDRVTSILL